MSKSNRQRRAEERAIWTPECRRAFGAWMKACYEHNVANGWPEATEIRLEATEGH